jgi:hypothetical protein
MMVNYKIRSSPVGEPETVTDHVTDDIDTVIAEFVGKSETLLEYPCSGADKWRVEPQKIVLQYRSAPFARGGALYAGERSLEVEGVPV